jgi:short-subunit dehydrogenase
VRETVAASTATEIWDASGLPLSALDQDTVTTAENLVDAALGGLDKGEAITWPTVADASLWDMYDAARSTLFVWQAGRALFRSFQSENHVLSTGYPIYQ